MPDQTKVITLSNGQTMAIPADTPPEVEARWRAQSEEHIKNSPAPQVPTGGNEPQLAGSTNPDDSSPAVPDPSEHDTWNDWIGKHAVAAVKGTGRGFAKFGDMLLNAGDVLINDAQSMVGATPSRDTSDAPAAQGFEKITVPVPKGKGYENTAEKAEIYGPAVVETMATGGLASPTALAAVPVRAARDVTLGIGAGEVGGSIGEMIDKAAGGSGSAGRALGQVASMAAPGAGTSGTRQIINKSFTDANTLEKLSALRRLNTRLPADKQIPVSLGQVGNKTAQNLEDVLARAPISGERIVDTRRKQVEGIENVTTQAAEQVRGAPASGKINRETIGQKADEMVTLADEKINAKLDQLANDMAGKVGRDTPVSVDQMEKHLNEVISSPRSGPTVREEATQLRDHLIKLRDDFQGPNKGGSPGYTTYEAVKNERGKVGKQVAGATNRPLEKYVTSEGYKGLTEDMRGTAVKQGVPEAEFDASQRRQQELIEDRKQVRKSMNKETGRAAHDTLLSPQKGQSTTQLAPFKEHTPDELGQILADKLELNLRGEANAGLPDADASTFPLGGLTRNWRSQDQNWKDFYTQNNPSIQRDLDDATVLAQAEQGRTGRYSSPSADANKATVNRASIPVALGGAGLGAGAGFYLHGLPGAVAGAVTPTIMSALGGRAMTNPRVVEYVANPKPVGLGDTLASAVGGGAAYNNREEQNAAEQRRRAEEEAQVRRWIGGG